MLIQFSYKNFKSFRDEAILDMTATRGKEFEEHIIKKGNEKILPLAAIFGANASGKSNVFYAFQYMTDYVKYSFGFGDDSLEQSQMKVTPFLFDLNSAHDVSTFEVYLTLPNDDNEKIYTYGFTVNGSGIVEEWLLRRAKTMRKASSIFYRNEEIGILKLSGLSDGEKNNLTLSLDKRALIISLGAKLKINICQSIRNWFINNRLSNFANSIESVKKYRYLPRGFTSDIKIQQDLVSYLSTFDTSIKGFKVERMEEDREGKPQFKIYTKHQVIGTNSSQWISLKDESAGTLKMFALYQELQDTLDNGGVLFVDELNARLHPLLLRHILQRFLNQETNQHGAQLIFTSHDVSNMTNELLRRDEIWFVEKDKHGLSSLYSMAEYKDETGESSRRDLNYMKNYLCGRYGGIPYINDGDNK